MYVLWSCMYEYLGLNQYISVVCVDVRLMFGQRTRLSSITSFFFPACSVNIESKHQKRLYDIHMHIRKNIKKQISPRYTQEYTEKRLPSIDGHLRPVEDVRDLALNPNPNPTQKPCPNVSLNNSSIVTEL